jgi:hypothetical protein
VNFSKWGIQLAEMRNDRWPGSPESPLVPEENWYRAVTVLAPAALVFRWVCQLRAAPYSYDWLDNFGRQSPPNLIDGLDQLRTGQKVMMIFQVHDFSSGSYLTVALRPRLGLLSSGLRITYLCAPFGKNQTRLRVRVQIAYPGHFFRPIVRSGLPLGDLFMMRKQLLNLKELAERSQSRGQT